MMHSESKNKYPIGLPKFWKGNLIPDDALGENKYYFIRIKTRFYLKKNKLPFIQIKNSFLYNSTENLETSDVFNAESNSYSPFYLNNNKTHDTHVILTLTMTDYKLLLEHYELVDFEILDGCYFYSELGLFDEYIEKYKKIKTISTGAIRELAKLFLNNLYGKLATKDDSSFKIIYEKKDGSLGFRLVSEHNKKAGYIPCGSAITSYSRNFTIRAGQQNFYGKNKNGFKYADTDSIHCDLQPNEIKGINIHNSNFCCWKLEASWDVAIFARQKTYIEHVIAENLEPCTPFYNIKCAGMPDKCKKLFEKSMIGDLKDIKNYKAEEQIFIKEKRELTDFKKGLKVPSKLRPQRIRGGIVLVDTTYEMR